MNADHFIRDIGIFVPVLILGALVFVCLSCAEVVQRFQANKKLERKAWNFVREFSMTDTSPKPTTAATKQKISEKNETIFFPWYQMHSTDSLNLMFAVVSKAAWEKNEVRGDQCGMTEAYYFTNLQTVLTNECISDKKLKKARAGKSAAVSGQPASIDCSDKLIIFFRSDEMFQRLFREKSSERVRLLYRGTMINEPNNGFMPYPVSRDVVTGLFDIPPISTVMKNVGGLSKAAEDENCFQKCMGTVCCGRCGRVKTEKK